MSTNEKTSEDKGSAPGAAHVRQNELSDDLKKIIYALERETAEGRKLFGVSFIQRRFKYGYVRAKAAEEALRRAGVISASDERGMFEYIEAPSVIGGNDEQPTPPVTPNPSSSAPVRQEEGEWVKRVATEIVRTFLRKDEYWLKHRADLSDMLRRDVTDILNASLRVKEQGRDSARLDWLEDRDEVSVTDREKVWFECGRLYTATIREAIDAVMTLGEPGGVRAKRAEGC